MANHNTSSAYDLSMYEPVPKAQPKPQPQLKVVEHRSAKRTLSAAFTARSLGAFTIVVTLISLMVYNQVCLNEINEMINEVQSEIEDMESEHVKLSSDLESMYSISVISERARDELGMERLDKFQTVYISLYDGDRITVSEHAPETEPATGAKLAARSIIDTIKEYIGAK